VPDATRRNEFGQPVGDPVPGWSGAAHPPGQVLKGRRVTLRPLEVGDAPGLHAAYEGQADADWTYLPVERPRTLQEVRDLVEERMASTAVTHAVLREGIACGVASLMRIDQGNGVIEIGWVAFGTPLQRTVSSTEAQRLLMGHVFDDLGYRRLEWKCDALNEPSMRAAAPQSLRAGCVSLSQLVATSARMSRGPRARTN
jgi:RimJ/RimL family protein N-acetyltransferase